MDLMSLMPLLLDTRQVDRALNKGNHGGLVVRDGMKNLLLSR